MPGPDDSGPASVHSPGASVSRSGARVDEEDAPPSSGPVSARDAGEEAPPSSGTYTRVRGAILLFVSSRKENEGRDFVVRAVERKLGNGVAPAMLEDIVQASLAEAVECRWPPWTVGGVPSWLARLTRRQVAAYFRAERGQKKRKPGQPDEPEPTARPRSATARNAEAARLDAHDDAEHAPRVEPRERTEWIRDRTSPPTDERARARLIHDYMARLIGDDPRKVDTLELMKEHAIDGFSLAELAAREKTTERALANRFHKLRKELAPQVRVMDDEKKRRTILALVLLFFVGALLAIFFWLWHALAPPPAPPAVPELAPRPSASAPLLPPVFDNANPTRPAPVEPSSEPPPAPKP
jgi:DNA-directed RNA polymerase specialized sigma24 family protein